MEILIVIIVLGIIGAVALRSMDSQVTAERTEETRERLDRLASAIAGDPNLRSAGVRTDFGYVGDIGSLPPSLAALVSNTPSYGTWDGPYLSEPFTTDGTPTLYATDAWGSTLAYNSATGTISSTGGSTVLTRAIQGGTDDLLRNQVVVQILDRSGYAPGTIDKDSLVATLTYPNGVGGYTSRVKSPTTNGRITYDSIPVGVHELLLAYTPHQDTVRRTLTIEPGAPHVAEIVLAHDHWEDTSGAVSTYDSVVLRPTGVGALSQLTVVGASPAWACVDETSSDGDGTYVRSTLLSGKTDLYALPDTTIAATIDTVVVTVRARRVLFWEYVRTVIRVGSTNYTGALEALASSSYTDFSTRYTTNPATGTSWTWSDIHALQAGVYLFSIGRCTQVWIHVHYH